MFSDPVICLKTCAETQQGLQILSIRWLLLSCSAGLYSSLTKHTVSPNGNLSAFIQFFIHSVSKWWFERRWCHMALLHDQSSMLMVLSGTAHHGWRLQYGDILRLSLVCTSVRGWAYHQLQRVCLSGSFFLTSTYTFINSVCHVSHLDPCQRLAVGYCTFPTPSDDVLWSNLMGRFHCIATVDVVHSKAFWISVFLVSFLDFCDFI